MRTFRFFAALLCLCSLVCSAGATRINIQDPAPPPLITSISSSPFDVTFSGDSCGILLPGSGASEMGCFGFLNRTSAAWTGLELVLPAAPTAFSFTCNDQPAAAPVFSMSSCGYNAAAGQFELFFTGGTLPNNTTQYFVISEDDLPPGALEFTAYATFASTPEPSSWLLFVSGAAFVGVLAWSRRRELAC